MPWKECNVRTERRRFVQLVMMAGANMSQLCREFGISRQTGYKWLGRYRAEGETGLTERSRRPHRSPRQTSAEMESKVMAVRRAHPEWGGRKIKRYLANRGETGLPAPSTITEIIRRHDGIEPEEAQKHRPFKRFEMAAPNQLWQMDFKGDFALADRRRCYPLTVLDDHSRYLVVLRACSNQTGKMVQSYLTEVFRRYGLPQRMLMDNGAPWSGGCHRCFTSLSVWLLRLDIRVSFSRPYHPQTLGKDERLHRTLNRELIRRTQWTDFATCQPHFDQWRQLYNHQRPHEAVQLDVPADHYQPSPRPYPERLRPVEYDLGQPVRKVDISGKIYFRNRRFFVGKAFAGHYVAIHEGDADGLFEVYFSKHWIQQIDIRQQEP